MIEVLRLATFLVFLALGAIVAITRKRQAVIALIAYIVAIHAMLVITNHDDWPFTGYPLIEKVSRGDAEYRKVVFYGVDANGREWLVDPDAWSPVSPPVLMQWFVAVFPKLTPARQQEAGRFLLAKTDTRKPHIPGAAPDWWSYTHPAERPSGKFAKLRVYLETFTPRGKLAGAPSRRMLMLESAR